MTNLIVIGAVMMIALLIFATFKPDTFHVERSVAIDASAEKIFSLLNDFNKWPSWSPWAEKDPNMQTMTSQPASGKGATYAWEGNKQVGTGSMTIITSSPPTEIGYQLNFLKPFKAQNTATFTLVPQGRQTAVTWSLDGPQPFINKLMSVFMNMDHMIGKDFEAGLGALKTIVEK